MLSEHGKISNQLQPKNHESKIVDCISHHSSETFFNWNFAAAAGQRKSQNTSKNNGNGSPGEQQKIFYDFETKIYDH
jgi:hypothetical protein